MQAQLAFQQLLRERLDEIRMRNPSYSVRSFARRVGLSPATVSLVLNGKRRLSRKLAAQLLDRLMIEPNQRAELLNLFAERQLRLPAGNASEREALEFLELSADQYEVIAEWRAFAILNLLETEGFRNDPAWIAQRLDGTTAQIEGLLTKLKRLGMLVEKNGELARGAARYKTADQVANLAIRRSHDQTLELARESLLRDPRERRDFTWVTVPMKADRLEDARALIRRFQDDLLALMDQTSGASGLPEEVYRVGVQLFPLSRPVSSDLPISKTKNQRSIA